MTGRMLFDLRPVICLLLCSATVFAQDDAAATADAQAAVEVGRPSTEVTIVEPQQEIILPVGQSVVLSTKFQLVPLEEASANSEICMAAVMVDDISDVPAPPRHCRVQALMHGTTTVTLLPVDPFIDPVTVKIVMVEDEARYDPVEELVKAQFPNSQVSIYSMPTSKSVLVVGEVENETDVADITNLLVTDDIPPEMIINRLSFRNHRFASAEAAIKAAFSGSNVKIVPIPNSPTVVAKGTVEYDDDITDVETILMSLMSAEGDTLVENVILRLEVGRLTDDSDADDADDGF